MKYPNILTHGMDDVLPVPFPKTHLFNPSTRNPPGTVTEGPRARIMPPQIIIS